MTIYLKIILKLGYVQLANSRRGQGVVGRTWRRPHGGIDIGGLVRSGIYEVVRTHAILAQGDAVLASLALPFERVRRFALYLQSCVQEAAQDVTGLLERTFTQLQKGIHGGLSLLNTTECCLAAAYVWCGLLPRPLLQLLCCYGWHHAAPLHRQQLCLDMPWLTPKFYQDLVSKTRPYTLDSARFASSDGTKNTDETGVSIQIIARLPDRG